MYPILRDTRGSSAAMSWLFTFVDGSDEVLIQCYLHTDQHAPKGWYKPAERRVRIGKAFQMPASMNAKDAPYPRS